MPDRIERSRRRIIWVGEPAGPGLGEPPLEGLFTVLRPGTLVSLRREWLRLDDQAISIPKMKSGEPFDLPLSEHMVGLVSEAINPVVGQKVSQILARSAAKVHQLLTPTLLPDTQN